MPTFVQKREPRMWLWYLFGLFVVGALLPSTLLVSMDVGSYFEMQEISMFVLYLLGLVIGCFKIKGETNRHVVRGVSIGMALFNFMYLQWHQYAEGNVYLGNLVGIIAVSPVFLFVALRAPVYIKISIWASRHKSLQWIPPILLKRAKTTIFSTQLLTIVKYALLLEVLTAIYVYAYCLIFGVSVGDSMYATQEALGHFDYYYVYYVLSEAVSLAMVGVILLTISREQRDPDHR